MTRFRDAGSAGFFDVDERLKEASAKGDALERLGPIVDFELFRPALSRAAPHRGPDTWQHPVTRKACPEILLAPEGTSTHGREEQQPAGKARFAASPANPV